VFGDVGTYFMRWLGRQGSTERSSERFAVGMFVRLLGVLLFCGFVFWLISR
jgi:hypothetical protein